MLKATREAVYRYRRSGVEEICEVVATPIGRFAVVHRTLKGRYLLGDKEEEWDLLNHKSFQDVKNVVLKYEDLPADVRRALPRAG